MEFHKRLKPLLFCLQFDKLSANGKNLDVLMFWSLKNVDQEFNDDSCKIYHLTELVESKHRLIQNVFVNIRVVELLPVLKGYQDIL